MAWEIKGFPLPPASLRLLVPPVRLMSAFMWQIVQQRRVMQYEKLLDFIGVVTEAVPDLLGPGHTAQLQLGLRARLVLELCRGDGAGNLSSIQSHLDKIHACSSELSSDRQSSGDVLKTYANFANLVQTLLNVPFEKEYFFQEVFPANYGSAYEQRLEQMFGLFLSRLEQLLPVPDLPQTAAWLSETAAAADDLGQTPSEAFALKTLLLHHRQRGSLGTAPPCPDDDLLLSALSLPPHAAVGRFAEVYARVGDDDDEEEEEEEEEGNPAARGSEAEGFSPGSEVMAEEWLPKLRAGSLSRLFVCPQCSFVHRAEQAVQEHIRSEHQAPPQRRPAKKAKARQKRKNADAEAGTLEPKEEKKAPKPKNSENRARRRRTEKRSSGGGGEDKRFLSARTPNRAFGAEETTCATCQKVFEHPNQLKTHARLHARRHHCSQCEKGFSSASGFYQHQRLHKKGRAFTCAQCHKGFLCRYSLRQHERVHAGPAHLCTVCGKSFSGAGIRRHAQMHRGERNYLCTTCGKSFLSSGELLLHTRSHTGELPYTCARCGKGFSCKSHLTVHTRSHTGERPYVCAQCPKRFLTLNCLKRHTLSHNGLKPFKCPSCDREFSQRGNLKRHLTIHRDPPPPDPHLTTHRDPPPPDHAQGPPHLTTHRDPPHLTPT